MDGKFKISISRNNVFIYEEKIESTERIKPSKGYSYHQKDPTSLDLKMDICFKENLRSKIANVFKPVQTAYLPILSIYYLFTKQSEFKKIPIRL